MEGSIITLQEIFAFEQTGIDDQGKVHGRFVFSGPGTMPGIRRLRARRRASVPSDRPMR